MIQKETEVFTMSQKIKGRVKAQMEKGETTFVECVLNQELGEPFRRDAMKKPVRVAGISADDMVEQTV